MNKLLISLDSSQPQFTASGAFANPALDENWACRTCHNSSDTSVIFPLPDAFVDGYIYHNNLP